MKAIVFIISVFALSQNLYSQSLKAKVVDENNKVLVGATVYFDGTTRGVITDLDGYFNIKKPENLNNPILVITYMGYESLYETDVNNLKPTYQLNPKPENLEAVNLYASPFSREEMLEVFKTYFLGNGRAARLCEIKNLDDVILYYVVEENTLYAKATNPIIIDNPYLGYNIKFDLKAFEVRYNYKSLSDNYLKQTFYAGFSFYEDINPKKERKRIKIYESSLSHFFKSLINNKLDETKFQIAYKGTLRNPESVFDIEKLSDIIYHISLKSNYIKLINTKYIPTKILLKHRSNRSTLQFSKPALRVDKNGNIIDIQNLQLIGDLANSRVAKMLPINFSPE